MCLYIFLRDGGARCVSSDVRSALTGAAPGNWLPVLMRERELEPERWWARESSSPKHFAAEKKMSVEMSQDFLKTEHWGLKSFFFV